MEKGYVTLPVLKKEKCDKIIEQLKKLQFRGRMSPDLRTGLDYDSPQSNIYEVTNQALIINIPEIKEISDDPKILEIVEGYFGAEPIQTQANCWWTVKHDSKLLSKYAQMFHQDHTYKKFIKLFLYLNDVGIENGCHVYVPESVNKGVQPPRKRPSQRAPDDYIKENFKEIKYMIGEKGTMNLVDTRGWHKGNPVKEGHRLLIQLEWTDNITHLATGKQLKYI